MQETNFYEKVERKQFAHSVKFLSPENEYWNTFKSSVNNELHLTVPFLRFCRYVPYDCVTCSAMEVRVFNGLTFECKKRLSFKTNPICADIRYDNKMIAVGGSNGMLRIYNNTLSTQLSVMRVLKGHLGEVRDVLWSIDSGSSNHATRILSCGNDKSIRYWDITESKQIGNAYLSHSDFVRSIDWVDITNSNPITNSDNNNIFISGSYDHSCKVWDMRVNNNAEQMSFDHLSPIEDCIHIPNSDLIAIAGTPDVSIWSMRKGGKTPVIRMKHIHRKTVNNLAVNKEGTRLFTACLDNHVRVFDTTNTNANLDSAFNNTHVFAMPSAVLGIDISNDGMCIAMSTLKNGVLFKTRPNSGNVDGSGNGNARQDIIDYLKENEYSRDASSQFDSEMKEWMQLRNKTKHKSALEKKNMLYGSKDWFIRGQKNKTPIVTASEMKEFEANKETLNKLKPHLSGGGDSSYKGTLLVDELTRTTISVTFRSRNKLKQYDMALKQFRYSDALDAALSCKDTLTVHSVLQDLWRRDGLEIALGGRDVTRLIPILEYCIYSVGHPHLCETTIHCVALIIDMYKNVIGGFNDEIDNLFVEMYTIVNNMIRKYKILLKLQGSIETILSAQDIISNPLPKYMLDFNQQVENIVQIIEKNQRNKNKNKSNNRNESTSNDIDMING